MKQRNQMERDQMEENVVDIGVKKKMVQMKWLVSEVLVYRKYNYSLVMWRKSCCWNIDHRKMQGEKKNED